MTSDKYYTFLTELTEEGFGFNYDDIVLMSIWNLKEHIIAHNSRKMCKTIANKSWELAKLKYQRINDEINALRRKISSVGIERKTFGYYYTGTNISFTISDQQEDLSKLRELKAKKRELRVHDDVMSLKNALFAETHHYIKLVKEVLQQKEREETLRRERQENDKKMQEELKKQREEEAKRRENEKYQREWDEWQETLRKEREREERKEREEREERYQKERKEREEREEQESWGRYWRKHDNTRGKQWDSEDRYDYEDIFEKFFNAYSGYPRHDHGNSNGGYQERKQTSSKVFGTEKSKHFNVLGLDPNKTYEKVFIRSTYRKLAMKYHPDKNGGKDEQFKILNNSFEYVLNYGV